MPKHQPQGNSIDPTLSAYGADKTGAVDATLAIRAARTAALASNGTVVFPPGTYTVSGRIHDAAATANPVRFAAEIPGTVTIQRTASVPIIEVVGSRGTAVALTGNVASGALSCTTATLPSGLVASDYVQLRSSTVFSGNAIMAEVLRVSSITGTGPYTINFFGRTEEAYATANSAVIEKLNLVAGSTITGITFRQTAINRDSAADALVQLKLTVGDRIERCTFRDADSPGIEPGACINWTYRDITVEQLNDDLANNRIGYGINAYDSCRDGTIFNLQGKFARHAFTTNANVGGLEGAPRHITLINPHVSDTSGAGLDTHAEGKHITFVNPHVHHVGDAGTNALGIQCRSPFTTIIDPVVVGGGTGGASIMLNTGANHSVIRGGNIVQSGNISPVVVMANDCIVDGTKITTVGTGYNASMVHTGGSRTTLRGLRVDQGDSNTTPLAFATGSVDNILDGGVFLASTSRAVVNILTGASVIVANKPIRGTANGATAFKIGVGEITYPNDTNRMRVSGIETMPRHVTLASGNTIMVNGRIYGARAHVEDGGLFNTVRITLISPGSGVTEFRVGVWDANTLALLMGSGDVKAGLTAGVASFTMNTIALTQGREVILGAVALFTTTGPSMRGGSTSAGLVGMAPALVWSLADDTYAGGALPNLTTGGRFGDMPWMAFT